MYDSLLVPLDGSQAAAQVLPYVRFLARGLDCRVILVTVAEPPLEDVGPSSPTRATPAKTESAEADYLDRVAATFEDSRLVASTEVIEGRAAESIIAYAEAHRPGLIVMATYGRSGPGVWVLGGVADRVISASATPVLLLRPGAQEHPVPQPELRSIIVPLDGSRLAEAALPHAEALASKLGMDIVLTRAVERPRLFASASPSTTGPASVPVPRVAEATNAVEREAQDYLDRWTSALLVKGLRARWELRHGPPAGEIVRLAGSLAGSIVAMTTHGRSGVGRWLLGSITNKVVRACDRPILLVHPEAG